MDEHLLESLRRRRPTALPLLIGRFGREATGIAYLILQSRDGAAEAAARAFAGLWRAMPESGAAPAAAELPDLRRAVLVRAASEALRLHAGSRMVDPRPVGAGEQGLRELAPLARAVVGLAVIGGLADREIAEQLSVPLRRVSDLRADALAHHPNGIVNAVRSSLDGLPVIVDAERVAQILRGPIGAPPRRRWLLPAAAGLALVLGAVLVGPWPGQQPSATAASPTPSGSGSPIPVARSTPAVAAVLTPPGTVRPYTLGDCGIADDLPVEFAGWVDPLTLDPAWNGLGDAVYTLVATDPTGPITCLWGRTLGGYARVRPAPGWTPPNDADGCPSSPVGEWGGYREVGGPGAFVLPDVTPGGWQAGEGTKARMLVRIAPPPAAQGRIGASLRSLGSGAVVTARVGSKPVDPLAPGSTAADRHARYAWVDGFTVPDAGCWVLNVTVGGAVVGAAVLLYSSGG